MKVENEDFRKMMFNGKKECGARQINHERRVTSWCSAGNRNKSGFGKLYNLEVKVSIGFYALWNIHFCRNLEV